MRQESYYRGYEVKTPKIYNTVILDSLTEIQKYCMYQLMGVDIEEAQIDIEPDSPEWKEWGKSAEMIRLLVRKFRDLPMHVIFVCSRKEDQDEVKRRIFTPNMPGKLANEVQGFIDHVGYLSTDINEARQLIRFLAFQPGKTYQAKNRFSDFNEIGILEPTMQKIYNLEIQ